jgi:NAD(P)H-dependent FMN reductase
MKTETIGVLAGDAYTESLPISIDNVPATAEQLAGYEFQVQVRDLAGALLGMGTVAVVAPNVKWSIPAAVVALMGVGSAALYRVKARRIDLSWEGSLKGGAVKKTGLAMPWQ